MAVDMFLEFPDNAELKGETRDKVYKDKNASGILAWSFGMSQGGTTHGTTGGGGAGKVNVQDISITRYVDKASPNLMLLCCNGKHITKGNLIVRKAGENPLEYIKYELEDIMIVAVSTGGSGGEDQLTENVTLNFGKFKYSYVPQNDTGAGDPAVPMNWDMQANATV